MLWFCEKILSSVDLKYVPGFPPCGYYLDHGFSFSLFWEIFRIFNFTLGGYYLDFGSPKMSEVSAIPPIAIQFSRQE